MSHEHAFDTYAAYHGHVLDLLQRARRSLLVFDPDLAQTGFESAAGIEALDALACAAAREDSIRILLATPQHVERHCPRLLRLVERHGQRMRIRILADAAAPPDACFIVGDGETLVARFHRDRARGKHIHGPSAEASRYTAQFETMWIAARSGPTGAPLGI